MYHKMVVVDIRLQRSGTPYNDLIFAKIYDEVTKTCISKIINRRENFPLSVAIISYGDKHAQPNGTCLNVRLPFIAKSNVGLNHYDVIVYR